MGSLIVSKQIEKQAIKAGLFVFIQSKKGGANIANQTNFQAKEF